MAAGDTITVNKDVGSAGVWRMVLSQASQSQTNWTSTIRVRLYMKNESPVGAYNNDGPSMSINGPGSNDWSDSHVPFNVSAGATDLVVDKSFTIEHNSDGTLSAAFSATLGTTGTGTFGSGGTVSGTIVLESLSTVPGTPAKPVLVANGSTSVTIKFADNADNGGIAVSARRIYYNTVNSTTGALYVTTSGNNANTVISGLDPKQQYYFWDRTMNTVGWSAYSTVLGVKTLAVPEPPTTPAITNIKQTSLTFSFTDGADNDSPITARQLAYSLTEGGAKTVIGTTNSGTATGLPPGSQLYIWARTQNAVGWSNYSAYVLIRTVAGFYVWDAGVKKEAIPYIWLDSDHAWHLLEPNARSNGVWKPGIR